LDHLKRARFNGVYYALSLAPIVGWCDSPVDPIPTLVIPGGVHGNFVTLENLLHEAIHACTPNLSEEQVTVMARDTARFLWRIGYRLKEA